MKLPIKKESAWQFITSSSGGIGVEFVAVEGGQIWLQNPEQQVETFYYGSAGVGLTAGFKLPKLGKLQLKVRGKSVGGAVAPSVFPCTGQLYCLDGLEGDDFRSQDLQGVCMYVQIFGGLAAGGSASAMIFGMDPVWLGVSAALGPIANSIATVKLLESAKGILLMAGVNVGIQAGGGVAAFLGGLM